MLELAAIALAVIALGLSPRSSASDAPRNAGNPTSKPLDADLARWTRRSTCRVTSGHENRRDDPSSAHVSRRVQIF